MTKQTMIKHYRSNSAADSYIIGYAYQGCIYFNEVKEIMPRYLSVEEASRNQGQNLRLRLKKAHRKELFQGESWILCREEDLVSDKYNRGEIFEKLITEYFGQEWEKDTVPFWEQGDIRLNGKEVQIKLDTATLTSTKQIARLKKMKKVEKRG